MHFTPSVLLGLGLLVAHVTAQGVDCPTDPKPRKSPPAKDVCNLEGHLYDAPLLDSFNTSSTDYHSCYANCISALYCYAFSYNTKTSECQLYREAIEKKNIKKNKAGVFNWNLEGCFKIPTSCRAFNVIPDGSFEASVNDSPWVGSVAPVQICDNFAQDGSCWDQLALPTFDVENSIDMQQDYIPSKQGVNYNFSFYYKVKSIFLNGSDTCELAGGIATGTGILPVQVHLPISSVTTDDNGYNVWFQSPIVPYTPDAPDPAVLFRFSCNSTASKVDLGVDSITLTKASKYN